MKHLIVLGAVLFSAFLVWRISIRVGVEEMVGSSIGWNIFFFILGIIMLWESGSNLLKRFLN